jgi:hypothetical protein
VIAAPDGRHPYLRASASRDAPRVDDAEVATSGVTAPFEVWQCDGEVTPARRVWLTLAPFDRNGGRLPIRARVEPVDFRVGGE